MFSKLWTDLSRPFSLDLRSLALFRVCLAVLIITDLLNRGLWLESHYTDIGVLPRTALLETLWEPTWVSVHMLSGSVGVQAILFGLAALAAGLLLVGWRTRLMTVLSWFLMISLHARNPVVLQGGDVVFRLLLFWSMFLPLGARWSVDAALATESDLSLGNRYFSLSSFAFIAQLSFIYLFSAILKTGDAWLTEYDAVYYALALDQFATPVGNWLLNQQALHGPLTIGTLGLEAFGWVLLVVPVFVAPLRLLATVLFVGMHLGFAATMQLGLFSYIMCVAWLALLPGAVWSWLEKRTHFQREGCRLNVPPGLYRKGADLAQVFLLLPRLEIKNASSRDTWCLQDGEEESYHGWDAWTAIVARSPLFSTIKWVLTNRIVETLAKWIGRGGTYLTDTIDGGLRRRSLRRYPTVLGSVFVALALGTTLAWNLHTVGNGWSMPPSWKTAAEYVRLDQRWGMFAPYPLKVDGWYVLSGRQKNGKTTSLFFDGTSWQAPTDKPDDVSSMYPNQRWRKYLMNLRRSEFSEQRPYFSQWLCRRWNTRYTGGRKLSGLSVYFIEERTPPSFEQQPELEKVRLRKHQCEVGEGEPLKVKEKEKTGNSSTKDRRG